jgi:hypothetical protein
VEWRLGLERVEHCELESDLDWVLGAVLVESWTGVAGGAAECVLDQAWGWLLAMEWLQLADLQVGAVQAGDGRVLGPGAMVAMPGCGEGRW